MSKFKAGDKVIDKIDNPPVHYTVYDVDDRGYLKITYRGYTHYYNPERFELVEEPNPVVFKLGSLYHKPCTGTYTYKCCGFTSTGLPFFEYPNGLPAFVSSNVIGKLVELSKPIEVGSRVYSNISDREFIVTAIHDGYAWVHTEGSKGGSIQNLSTLKRLG